MFDRRGKSFTAALAGAIDLAIDFATLGEYGLVAPATGVQPAALEPAPADGPCELDGHRAAWEALAGPNRGSCARPHRPLSRRQRLAA